MMSRNTLPPSLTVAAALLCILVSVTAMPLIEAERSKSSWFAWAATAFATLLVGTAAAVVLMGTAAAKAVTSTTLGAAPAPEKLLKGVEDEDEKWMASCVQSFGEERCNAGALDVPSEKADEEAYGDESTDAGSSDTIPMAAGQIRKGGYIMIKGKPCKVSDVSTSKTGKHGHAKCHFVAIDIFTGKKMEDLVPSSHNTLVPVVTTAEYTVLDVGDDGALSLLTAAGETKDDLNLPDEAAGPARGSDESKAIAKEIQEKFAADKSLIVTVRSAVGQEMICAVKEDTA